LNIQASLEASTSMASNVPNPTFPMSWDYYEGLLVDVLSIVMCCGDFYIFEASAYQQPQTNRKCLNVSI